MNNEKFFQLNKSYYYVDQRVVILKLYEKVHMAKIKILDTNQSVIIDMSALSWKPIHENTVTIKMLGGDRDDFGFF